MKRTCRDQDGFTLLEVLVALVVVAVALAALLKGASGNAINTAYLRDKTFAQWVAMNVVAERQLGLSESSQSERGEAEMGGRSWRWTAELKETFDEAIWRLEVEVSPADAEGDETVMAQVVAFLPKPEEEGGSGVSAAGL
ncbi:MAG: type II secretion system minor pseudopilin GspI [Pseudomonadota bacterium]